MTKTPHTDFFADLLRKHGFRATRPRLALLETLADAKRPLSAATIARTIGERADQATVYRGLENLLAKQIVKKVNMEHPHAHYELAHEKDHHHHIICRGCGTVEELRGCAIRAKDDVLLARSERFHEIESHSLEFFGTCDRCTKRRVRQPFHA